MRWLVVVLGCASAAIGCAYEVRHGRPDARVDDATIDAHVVMPFELDRAFGTNGTVEIPAMGSSPYVTLLSNGVVVVSMMVPPAPNSSQPPTVAVCRIQSDGTVDLGFSGGCITRNWWGSPRQVAADGDAILVAANRPQPALSRILATGLDDSAFGTNGVVNLTPSGFGSDVIALRVWRLSDGSHAVSGSGTYIPAAKPAAWIERVQGGAATTTSFVFEAAALTEVLEVPGPNSSTAFVATANRARLACPTSACTGGDQCRYGACIPAPLTCTATSCASGFYCDSVGNECIPDNVGNLGTRTMYTSPDWSTTYSDVYVGNRGARYSAEGFLGLYHVQPFMFPPDVGGLWRQTHSGAADANFGMNGIAMRNTPLSAVAGAPGGYTYVATAGSSGRLYRLRPSGQMDAEASGVVPDLVINDIAVQSNTLLIAGMKGSTLYVQRFVLHPEVFRSRP